MKTAVSGSAWC